MLLKRLVEFGENRMEATPLGYDYRPVRWLIKLDKNGSLLGGPVSLPDSEGVGKGRGTRMLLPDIPRSSNIEPKLLSDNGEYVLGLEKAAGGKQSAKVIERHSRFVSLIEQCIAETSEHSIKAVLSFLHNTDYEKIMFPDDFDPGQDIAFEVNGIRPDSLPSIRAFWIAYLKEKLESDKLHQCNICGSKLPALRIHPMKIKKVPQGQTSGNTIIAANAAAFESYGLESSFISPTCYSCAETYAKAANHLIAGDDTHITLGPVVYLFWTKEPGEWNPVGLLSRPDPDQVKALFQSVRRGKEVQQEIRANEFYATALSASGSRVAVRDWLETTIPQAKKKMAQWFRWQHIVDAWTGEIGDPLPVRGYWHEKQYHVGLADHLAPLGKNKRRKVDDLPAQVFQTLMNSALTGMPLPDWLLAQAVRRNCAEQNVTYPRAALIKAILHSQRNKKEVYMEYPDPNHPSSAYHCGR
ncbi:MAG: type I-C CRISPR-associated protein Cas8c/Csd1, partial [Candidatus Brocadiales bacterium]|nr:type I-C CRISPR-associated protein Cas8c/Csd1 [Candidatus Bathyanammoxibius sp.]